MKKSLTFRKRSLTLRKYRKREPNRFPFLAPDCQHLTILKEGGSRRTSYHLRTQTEVHFNKHLAIAYEKKKCLLESYRQKKKNTHHTHQIVVKR